LRRLQPVPCIFFKDKKNQPEGWLYKSITGLLSDINKNAFSHFVVPDFYMSETLSD
jgi:hypothetical protein